MTATTMIWLSPADAAAAVNFYTHLFRDSRIVFHRHLENADQGDSDVWELILDGTPFQVMGAGNEQPPSMAISLVLKVDDQPTLDRYWDGILDAGGHELACGWIVDQFGVNWQICPQFFYDVAAGRDTAKAQRVAEALWNMTRIDIAQLRAAAEG